MTFLGSQRDLFDIPAGVTYLNAAYMSPQLRAVTAAGLGAVRWGAHPWEKTIPDFFEPVEAARELFATIVGGDADRSRPLNLIR